MQLHWSIVLGYSDIQDEWQLLSDDWQVLSGDWQVISETVTTNLVLNTDRKSVCLFPNNYFIPEKKNKKKKQKKKKKQQQQQKNNAYLYLKLK